jgi:hypothetical protein
VPGGRAGWGVDVAASAADGGGGTGASAAGPPGSERGSPPPAGVASASAGRTAVCSAPAATAAAGAGAVGSGSGATLLALPCGTGPTSTGRISGRGGESGPTSRGRTSGRAPPSFPAASAYGPDVVRVETTLTTRPLYEQYRDGDGVLQDNVRADRVQRYQVEAVISVTVRDVSVLERVYGAVVAARPTSIGRVAFRLEPDNGTTAWLADQAVGDAARRADRAATSAGARRGGVRVIDPSGRTCQTDVLAGWPSYGSGAPAPTTVQVTGSRVRRDPAGAPTPLIEVQREELLDAGSGTVVDYLATVPAMSNSLVPEDSTSLTLQPPMQWLSAQACVVYALD